MKFFLKSGFLVLLCAVFFVSGEWAGYMPFSPEETESGLMDRGTFFIPVPETHKKKGGKTTRYTKFISVAGACSLEKPCACPDPDFTGVPKQKITENNFKLLKQWCSKDKKTGMLFRPYVFYDVMGMMEYDFQGQPKGKIPTPPNWTNSRKKSGILTAIYNANGDATNLDEKKFKTELENYPGRRALLGSKFEVKQIQKLRQEITTVQKSTNPGSFAILDGYKIGDRIAAGDTYPVGGQQKMLDALKQTDIRYLMETHPGAVFQVASTANCLEGGMYSRRLEQMAEHPAQGEETRLGTMGGAVIIKYGLPYQPSLFGELAKAGVITLGDDFSAPTKVLRAAQPAEIDIVAVGIHRNVPVTSGYANPLSKSLSAVSNLDENDPRVKFLGDNYLVAKFSATESRDPLMVFNKFIEYPDRKPVDLILTSALDIKRGALVKKINKTEIFVDEKTKQSAKVVLKAAYLGTILATAYLGKKDLYLTLVGTGAFGNPFDYVIDAFKVGNKLDPEIVQLVRDYGIKITFVIYPDLKSGRGTKPSEVVKLNKLISDLNAAINSAKKSSGPSGTTEGSEKPGDTGGSSQDAQTDDSDIKYLAESLAQLLS